MHELNPLNPNSYPQENPMTHSITTHSIKRVVATVALIGTIAIATAADAQIPDPGMEIV